MQHVLVVVTEVKEVVPLLRWGARFAKGLGLRLAILHCTKGKSAGQSVEVSLDDDEKHSNGVVAAVVGAIRELAPQRSEGEEEPLVHHVAHPDEFRAIIDAVGRLDVKLLLLGRHQKVKAEHLHTDVSARLLDYAPCHTMVMRAGPDVGERCESILVPAAGGPHACQALKIIQKVALFEDADITALYVQAEVGEESRDVGLRKLERALKDASIKHEVSLLPRVVVDDNAQRGIREVAKEGFDLLIVGASNAGRVRRTLFGTAPDTLLAGSDGMTVAVIRKARPLLSRTREALARRIESWIPQLERDDRVAVFERLESGSRWDIDFLALIALSTAIAALGLIQDSAAVVIGAMLVAPLLTPMIGAGLGLVQGNVVLVKRAARAIGFGFLIAVLIGFVFGLITPIPSLTPELLARGSPNILDLVIALISGMAAAYAIARPNLSGALPGVAIAAALVPPIATAGVCLAMGETATARGAAGLFGTNLVAIILGAALTLRLLGVRGNRKRGEGRLWSRRIVLALSGIALVAAFPLGWGLISSFAEQRPGWAPVTQELRDEVHDRIDDYPGATLISVDRSTDEGDLVLNIVVESAEPLPEILATDLDTIVTDHIETPVRIRLSTTLVIVSDSGGMP